MEGQIDAANKFAQTDEGQKIQQSFGGNDPTGDPQTDAEGAAPSFDAQGNAGAPGQYGQEGQYGAVRGKGLGGALGPQDPPPPQGQEGQGGQQAKGSNYEGYDQNESTTEGGWGQNTGGGAFSRSNQLGTDNNAPNAGGVAVPHDDHAEGYKTGYSTPGYRREDDEEEARQNNQNEYGVQADDRGSKGNDLHEADI